MTSKRRSGVPFEGLVSFMENLWRNLHKREHALGQEAGGTRSSDLGHAKETWSRARASKRAIPGASPPDRSTQHHSCRARASKTGGLMNSSRARVAIACQGGGSHTAF